VLKRLLLFHVLDFAMWVQLGDVEGSAIPGHVGEVPGYPGKPVWTDGAPDKLGKEAGAGSGADLMVGAVATVGGGVCPMMCVRSCDTSRAGRICPPPALRLSPSQCTYEQQ
jgi:hypothetical protein